MRSPPQLIRSAVEKGFTRLAGGGGWDDGRASSRLSRSPESRLPAGRPPAQAGSRGSLFPGFPPRRTIGPPQQWSHESAADEPPAADRGASAGGTTLAGRRSLDRVGPDTF